MTEDLGRVLAGRYRLSGLLGRGGMGAVWRAHDRRLDREARAAAGLKHPGIITVHDRVTSDDGRPWIVMELARGQSLDDLIRAEGPQPVERVARIGLQILEALRTAHQAGITHRDIKPANVLLEGDRVVVTDFGIAAVEGDAALTRSGAMVGTPAFMAPEQVRGLPATAQSDLWSLGVTLFTAVQGHPPFNGTSPGAVLVAVVNEEPAVHAGPLTPAIAGLLRKDPAERPTTEQLQALLTRQLTPQHQAPLPPPPGPPPLPQPGPPARFHPPGPGRPSGRRRSPALIAAIVAAALAVTAAVAVAGYVLVAGGESAYERNVRAVGSWARHRGSSRGPSKTSGPDGSESRSRPFAPAPARRRSGSRGSRRSAHG